MERPEQNHPVLASLCLDEKQDVSVGFRRNIKRRIVSENPKGYLWDWRGCFSPVFAFGS
jgi:hypothetical protein